jgi:hypothetical protein
MFTNYKITYGLIASLFFLLLFVGSSLYAQSSNNQSGAIGENEMPDFQHFYDDITISRLSQLYWKLEKFHLSDNSAIDNYLKINECDIFLQYSMNEFEWRGIRERAREYIKNNVESFPYRFKYVQPLRLRDFNFETNIFEIDPMYQIDGIRKFEVVSTDFQEMPCGVKNFSQVPDVEGYPKALLVELTQPLDFKGVPMRPEKAREYVEKKMIDYESLIEQQRTRENMYSLRTAYIVMKIRIISYKGMERIENGRHRATVYAFLEGYEVYSDLDHTDLLYYENFTRTSAHGSTEVRLREQYEAMRQRRGQAASSNNAQESANDNSLNPEAAITEEPTNPLNVY